MVDQPPILPQWAPRLKRESIARLYASNAAGEVDQDLVDEVGIGLLARCRSILQATAASRGQVRCPVCETSIVQKRSVDQPKERRILACGSCDWQAPWKAYRKSYQGKQLIAGGMKPFFEAFVVDYPKAATYATKMVAIDTLIHRCHHELKGTPKRIGVVNLIQGKMTDVITFLEELAYSEESLPEMRRNLDLWRWKRSKNHRSDLPPLAEE
mgnify:CR=1 FL=1